jgi:hypothetical protein
VPQTFPGVTFPQVSCGLLAEQRGYCRYMPKWEIQILMDDKPQVIVIDAHSARAALAQLERHRAAGARNNGLAFNYTGAGGVPMAIRWGRAGIVTIGAVTAIGPWGQFAPA